MAIRRVPRYVTTNGEVFDTQERAIYAERCDNLYALRIPDIEVKLSGWLVDHAEQVIAALTVEIKDE